MLGLNLFIAGIEKAGTTSLADWLVTNSLAEYRVPGIKEPYSYASGDVSSPPDLMPTGVLLDASVGYAFDPNAIARMPEHHTKVILCFRNHFDRCFSAYSNHQAIARRDETSVAFARTLPGHGNPGPEAFFEGIFAIHKRYFSAESEKTIRKYFEEQAENICSQSFKERVHYEIGFFLRRRTRPFFSILDNSFYIRALKNLLVKYRASDLHLLTLDQLDTEDARAEFTRDLLGEGVADGAILPPLPRLNSTTDIGLGIEKPDFHAAEWDFLREYFRQDLIDLRATANGAGVSMKYVNQEALDKYLVQPGR